MPLVAQSIPNLVSGVSQQPAPSRLPTSGEEMINAFPSVVSGLMKRSPTEFVAQLSPSITVPDTAAVHMIDRDLTEKYIVVAGAGDLEVYDEVGNKQTVTFPDGKTYLPTTDIWKKMRFVTVADTTFCLNTEKVVASSTITETREDPTTRASVFVKQAVPSQTYALYVNGVLAGSTTTNDNTTASTALEGTATIAQELATNLISNGYTDATVHNSTVTFGITSGDTLAVLDEFGGQSMKAYTDTVPDFSDLPPGEAPDRLVKVQDLEDYDSAYWLRFDAASGVWQETVGYDAQVELDPATMPHILVKTGPGTFEFRQNNWLERPVGDDETNPLPSYVGGVINGIFLYKGRLGLLGGENVVLSEVGNFEQQFRTTVLQLLASDLIDVASVTGRVNTLYHAIAFSDELLLLSDKQQFRLTSGTILAADSVGITPSTAYPASPFVPPVNVATSAYFVADGPTNTVAREIYVDVNRQTVKADDIAVQVPTYIPLKVRAIAGSTSANAFVIFSETEPSTMYLHKWYEVNDEKVQSAWCKWIFDENLTLLGMGFLEDVMYIVYKVGADIRIDKMLVGPVIDKELLLDHQFTEADFTTFSYDSGTNTTTVVTPYDTPATIKFYRTDDNSFGNITATKTADDTYEFSGDITGYSITAGLNYEFLYQMSDQYIREESSSGEAAVQDGRLQLQYLSLIYTETSYFTVEVTPTSGSTKTYTFSGRFFGDADNTADTIPRDTGEFKVPVFAQNDQVVIQFKNDQPYRSAFGSLEWTAQYRQKARRI